MSRHETSAAAHQPNRLDGALTILQWPIPHDGHVIHLDEDALRIPVTRELRRRVRTLLDRGERTIVLDLARVTMIDAAGVGELVSVYNFAIAGDRRLRVVNATPRVREILERVGLFNRFASRGV